MQVVVPEIEGIKHDDHSIGIFQDADKNHYLDVPLLTTKVNRNGWSVSPETIDQNIHDFIGRDFMISEELIKANGGHYFEDTFEDTLTGYKNHSHGKFERIRGPFFTTDGHKYYRGDIKLRDSKAASVIKELGPKLSVPFGVSPHIWVTNSSGGDIGIKYWRAVGMALVDGPANGPDFNISKMCIGTQGSCFKSLAASEMCKIEDQKSADIITSLVSKMASINPVMSLDKQVTDPAKDTEISNNNETQNTPEVPAVQKVEKTFTEQKVEDNDSNATVNPQSSLTNSPLEKSVSISEDQLRKFNEQAEIIERLETKDRVNTLNGMFNVIDEKERKVLVDKYSKNKNVDELKDFLETLNISYIPAIVKKAIADNEAQKNTEAEANSKKLSKAAASIMRVEKVRMYNDNDESQSKAASTEQKFSPKELRSLVMGGN